jgi:hypothetical protein
MVPERFAALAAAACIAAAPAAGSTADRPVAGYGLWATLMTITADSYISPGLDGPAIGDTQLAIFGSSYSGFIVPDHFGPGRHKYHYSFPDMPEGEWIASSNLSLRMTEIAATDAPDHCGYLFDFCQGDLAGPGYRTASGWFEVMGIVDDAWNGTDTDPRGTNPAQWQIREFIAFEDLDTPGSYETFFAEGASFTPETAEGVIGRTTPVPLPAPAALLGVALGGLFALRRRRAA